jgi:Uma2 family endonuclease
MVQSKPLSSPLTEDDLPYTDNQLVDNELQILIPVLLRAILSLQWADRTDWFFAINMGIYPDPVSSPAIGPDAFLSLGVQRYKRDSGRLSYVVPQENNVTPQWVLEVVSKTPGGEYTEKLARYAEIGVLYYTIYNPDYWQRDHHDPFELYRLEAGQYVRQQGNPVWMPEADLGIGYAISTHEELKRTWLYWYDKVGNRYPAPENVIQQERQLRMALVQQLEQTEQQLEQTEQQLQRERQWRENLLVRMREQGITIDEININETNTDEL